MCRERAGQFKRARDRIRTVAALGETNWRGKGGRRGRNESTENRRRVKGVRAEAAAAASSLQWVDRVTRVRRPVKGNDLWPPPPPQPDLDDASFGSVKTI